MVLQRVPKGEGGKQALCLTAVFFNVKSRNTSARINSTWYLTASFFLFELF